MIRLLLLAMPLTLVWVALNNSFSWATLLVGYIFSVAILLMVSAPHKEVTSRLGQVGNPIKQLWMFTVYAVQLAVDILLSGFDVASRLLTKDISKTTAPDFVTISTDTDKRDWVVSALSAHAITITPGSLVVDYGYEQDDESIMLVHVLDSRKWTQEVMQEEQRRRGAKIRGWLGHD